MLYFVLGTVVVLFVSAIVASEFRNIAEMKGHEGKPYFWFTFFFGIIGMLMVIALPDRSLKSVSNPSTTTNIIHPSTPIKKKPASYPKADEWKCPCGRIHKDYVSSCSCGASIRDAVK